MCQRDTCLDLKRPMPKIELPRRLPESHPGACPHCAGTGERVEFGLTETCCYCGGSGEGKE